MNFLKTRIRSKPIWFSLKHSVGLDVEIKNLEKLREKAILSKECHRQKSIKRIMSRKILRNKLYFCRYENKR